MNKTRIVTGFCLLLIVVSTFAGCAESAGKIVKEIYIAPDLGTYLYAISMWDADKIFPVFMDKEDRYTKKFAEAYADGDKIKYVELLKHKTGEITQQLVYKTLYAAWGPETLDDLEKNEIGQAQIKQRLAELGHVPEGIVITNIKDAEFAGGIALAAGHKQILDFMTTPYKMHNEYDIRKNVSIYKAEKEEIRLQIIEMLRQWGYPFEDLGQGIDYITLALDIVHHYTAHKPGLSLDDAINRLSPDGTKKTIEVGGKEIDYYDCYAYTGRLVEVARYTSLYQAMCPLFLGIKKAAFFDFYRPEWQLRCKTGAWIMSTLCYTVFHDRETKVWGHYKRRVGDKNDFSFIYVNSAGGAPDKWMGGKMEYIVDSWPAVVYFSHSNAGRNPKRIDSIAGKWLYQGAFIWRGAIMEPTASSFNNAETVVLAFSEGKTFGEAFQRKKTLPPSPLFSKPWRLIYIGDPMYRPEFEPWDGESSESRNYRQAIKLLFDGKISEAISRLEDHIEQVSGKEQDKTWQTLLDSYRLKAILSQPGKPQNMPVLPPLFIPHWYTEAMSYSPWLDSAIMLKQQLLKNEQKLIPFYQELLDKAAEKKHLARRLKDHSRKLLEESETPQTKADGQE